MYVIESLALNNYTDTHDQDFLICHFYREPRLQNFLWVYAPGTPRRFVAPKLPFIGQYENISFLQTCDYETMLP
jgi:hypothetical protein